jgi:hypothetical protein
VAGSCEHGNEPSVSKKVGNFLIFELPSSTQEGLWSMD